MENGTQAPSIPEYKIVSAPSLEKLEQTTMELVQDGWQILGPIGYAKNAYYHEMLRMRVDESAAKAASAADARFREAMDAMDRRVFDLLEINGIRLMCVDGKLYTKIEDKVSEGIDPKNVLNALKNSRHYPIDMDDNFVLEAIESLL